MEALKLEKEYILALMNKIDDNIEKLYLFQENINKKNSEIETLIGKLTNKNFFDLDDSLSNLSFQKNILLNEKKYSSTLKKIFLEKIYNDVYVLAENILMFVSSIDTIEFEDNNEKINYQKKISTIKQVSYKNLSIKNLFNLINSINNNLDLIKQIIDIFNKYILQTRKTITENNFHCKTFETNLGNQRQHMIIEYNKYTQQLKKIMEYYKDFSCCIYLQLKNQKIIEFCISKDIDLLESDTPDIGVNNNHESSELNDLDQNTNNDKHSSIKQYNVDSNKEENGEANKEDNHEANKEPPEEGNNQNTEENTEEGNNQNIKENIKEENKQDIKEEKKKNKKNKNKEDKKKNKDKSDSKEGVKMEIQS